MSAAPLRARRSSLILPVNVPRFVEKAALRGADAIVLDLEDSVPPAEKATARRLVVDALPLAGRGGAEVVVRVNNDPAHLWDDVAAAVHPGPTAWPCQAESPEQIRSWCAASGARNGAKLPGMSASRRDRDTPRPAARRGDRRARGDRIATMGVGVEDYCLSWASSRRRTDRAAVMRGWSPSPRPRGSADGAHGEHRGLSGPRRVRGRRRAPGSSAARARAASIPIRSPCSTASSPIRQGQYARQVVDALPRDRAGTASVSLDGKMVDIPSSSARRSWPGRVVAERRKADAPRPPSMR